MKSFSGFSEWIQGLDEGFGTALVNTGSAIVNFPKFAYNKLVGALKAITWAATNPTKVPSSVKKFLKDEYDRLEKAHGPKEAKLIMFSLIVSLGPAAPVPGSIAIFFLTIGACKLYHHLFGDTPPEGKGALSQEEVNRKVEEIKRRGLALVTQAEQDRKLQPVV